MEDLLLDGQVAIVSGAGRGLGRAYAELLAARGARVVINDPGTALDGSGSDQRLAREVVASIESAGGTAIANFDPVGTEAAARSLVRQTLDAFGKVDIVVNNAGTFTPRNEFVNTRSEGFESLFQVHAMGAIHTSRAVWRHMCDRKYGKIINVTSAVAYFGSAGRLEYATAKGAVHGFTVSLSQESLRYGIYVNAISPTALTRPVIASTNKYPQDDFAQALSPDLVAPTVVWLAHPATTINGKVFITRAGTTAQLVIGQTYGFGSDTPTPEEIRDNIEQIFVGDEAERVGLEFPLEASDGSTAMVARFGHRGA